MRAHCLQAGGLLLCKVLQCWPWFEDAKVVGSCGFGMGFDDGECRWDLDGEAGVEADGVDVEGGDLQCFGVELDAGKDGGVDGCGDEDEGVGGEDLVLGDERFERLGNT